MVRYCSRLFGQLRQQQTTDDYLHKIATYQPINRLVIIQADLAQGYNHTDFNKTSATGL